MRLGKEIGNVAVGNEMEVGRRRKDTVLERKGFMLISSSDIVTSMLVFNVKFSESPVLTSY